MLDKVKANASKGNPNASSHEVAKTMLQSVVAKRTQLIELGGGLDATMEIPDGRGGASICNLLLRAIQIHYRAHGGYLGHRVQYVEDRNPPQNGEACPPVLP
jgi:hypothetical protein